MITRPATRPPVRRHAPQRLLVALLALALLLPALAAAPPAARADTPCQVTNGNDTGAGSLRAALGNTDGFANCDTITFAPGVTQVAVATYLTIARAVTLQGPGAGALTIRHSGAASSQGTVLSIQGGPVTIHGLTVADGKANGGVFGAGLSIAAPVGQQPVAVALDGVAVTNNATTAGAGGGIYASNATLTITSSTIAANSASGGSYPRQGGGGLFIDDGFGPVSATLANTTVIGNTTGSVGGGIGVVDTAPGDGRAVALTVTASTVGTAAQPNTAGNGGGLYSAGGTTTVTNSTVGGNVANGGLGGGGGIYSAGGTTTVTNSTISGNSGYISGGFYTNSSVTTLRFVTVTGNTATSPGGTGGLAFSSGSLAVLSSIVAGNQRPSAPSDCGGAITSQGRNLWGDQAGCPNNAVGGDQNLFALNVALAAVLDPTLADNGGPTRTHNLVAGGPAVNKGDNVTCATAPPNGPGGLDQRSAPRNDGKCDVGAVEYTPPAPSPSPSPPGSPAPSASPSPTPSMSPGPAPSASPSPTPSTSPGPAPSFADVPVGYWAHDQIIAFAWRGITTGCDVNLYCPERPVTRAEMAVFLDRTLGFGTPATPASQVFTDVPPNYWAYAFIDQFAKLGITTGCGPGEFCPDRGVTRAEMAAFLLRALKQGQLALATPTFADVPANHPQFGYIEALVQLGVTTGCGTNDAGQRLYCPDRGVTRAEMAVFIIRAFP